MKAIVTGANGFVGSYLVKELIKNNVEVLCVDLVFSEDRLPYSKLIKKLQISIENIEEIENVVNFKEYDTFYHFAWIGSAGPLRMDEKIQVNNAMMTVNCLRVAKKIGCDKFICAGSIMEYEVHAAIYAQESKPGLSYLYGVGKVLAHELCKPIANDIGIDLIWAYITNAYGVGEYSPRFINSTLRKINNSEKLEFTSGVQNYDFIYIDDVARAFYLLGLKGIKNNGYIIGSGNARPLKEFIIEMTSELCPDNKPIFGNVPFTGINIDAEIFDISPLKNDCGFEPKISFKEGIVKTSNWLKEMDK